MTTFEVAQQIPDYGMFNRAYLFRDYDHLRRVFDGPIGEGYRRAVADKMGIGIPRCSPISARARSICARSAASKVQRTWPG